MIHHSDPTRDAFMLTGDLAREGYDWWWHSFTGTNRTTGEEKSFFIEFFTINPALGGEEPTFATPSYLMVKAGAWGNDAAQLHRFFGWHQVRLPLVVPFSVEAGDCLLTESATRGSVSVTARDAASHPEWMSNAGSMSWNLLIDKKIAYNVGYGASRPLRDSGVFQMYWHAEGMKTAYSGEVIWNGEAYDVCPETSFGYADKNWGKDFTSPWVWLSSCDLRSLVTGQNLRRSAFDIGGGRPKIGQVALDRKLLATFCREDERYEFNFSKFWTLTKTDFSCRETEDQLIWHVEQETLRHRMITDVTCDKRDMLLIRYQSPDGASRHKRLWNGGNGRGTVQLYARHPGTESLIDAVEANHVGCEYGVYAADE